MAEKARRHEAELYEPVRSFLEAQGFTVRGEVRGCDVVASRDDDLVIVELKRGFNVDLLLQATERQRLSQSVYIAVPAPLGKGDRARWRDILRLLRRLELGALLVHFDADPVTVEVCLEPQAPTRRRDLRERRAVLREARARTVDGNVGGSVSQPRLTAYREATLYLAYCLARLGPLAPKRLRELGAGRAQTMLRRNYYGWFERAGRGIYALTPAGHDALAHYETVTAPFPQRLDERLAVEAAGRGQPSA